MPKYLKGQRGSIGAIPILILLAAVGLLGFLLISNTFSFRDTLFNRVFPKPPSSVEEQALSVPDEILFKFNPGISETAKENIRASHNTPNIKYAEPNFWQKFRRLFQLLWNSIILQ